MDAMVDSASPTTSLPEYYSGLGSPRVSRSFKNFDDPKYFEQFDRDARSPCTRNLVVDFGDDEAYCASNLESHDFPYILKSPRPAALHTRWINIWLPYTQKQTLYNIAKHYDFSPRLLAVMSSDPVQPPAEPLEGKSHSSFFRRPQNEYRGPKTGLVDLEKSYDGVDVVSNHPSQESDAHGDVFNHYQIVNDVWHWSSVDWGRQYVCIGYNSLYPLKAATKGSAVEDTGLSDMPRGVRVWTWLVLTVDKTIISIREDPFPFSNNILDTREYNTMLTIRRNLMNVFRQLSKAYDTSRENPMAILPIRNRLGKTVEETAHRPTDSPGLLFFYLFEDWFSAFNLVARREHRYAAELNKLRENMLVKAELLHIDRLHHIGAQLAVLKRLYQSYEMLIERVLEKQEATLASLKNSHIVSHPDSLESSRHQVMEAESLLGVSLSSAAKVRFARLRVAIRLYALSEIQECLDQKESLVMMNFNLMAIKESYSVEKLTRITLLLAKVTILFMPVSLMTAYFGTELANVSFTKRDYWIWFGTILGASIAVLMAFSFASGTMEGRFLHQSFVRSVMRCMRRRTEDAR